MLPSALAPGMQAKSKWFVVSTTVMTCAWILANSIPLFSDIVSITGALLSTQCAFTFPAVLFLSLWRQGFLAKAPGSANLYNVMAVCAVGLLVLAVYSTISGTLSSVVVMLNDAKGGTAGPFACKLE